MQRINVIRYLLCSVTITGAISVGNSVQACPDLANICEQQRQHHELMQELGRQQSENYANSVYEAYSSPDRPSYPGENHIDPEAEKLEATIDLGVSAVRQQAELLQDPNYIRYLTGIWKFFPTPEGQKKGEYCTAFFSREGVMVTLSGPGGDYKGALLTFMSADIPRPQTTETVKVTLTQNDDPPATVQAWNYSTRDLPFGSIALAVPTIEALLAGMEDVQSFDLKIAGKSIANLKWHSGLAASDELRKCLSGKPYSVTDIDLLGK